MYERVESECHTLESACSEKLVAMTCPKILSLKWFSGDTVYTLSLRKMLLEQRKLKCVTKMLDSDILAKS